MNYSDETYQLIETYLRGKMSIKEALDFEQLMDQDLPLTEEVLLQKAINETIFSSKMAEISTLIDSEFETSNKKSSLLDYKY